METRSTAHADAPVRSLHLRAGGEERLRTARANAALETTVRKPVGRPVTEVDPEPYEPAIYD